MMKDRNQKKVGNEGEMIAESFLKNLGYEIVEKNYRYGHGEIDLIAKDLQNNCIVFVEVKSRRNLEFGEPEYAITKSKIKQLKKIAGLYLYDKNIEDIDCRFDVIAILFRGKQSPLVKHYKNAFD